jgi:hypothetical protein
MLPALYILAELDHGFKDVGIRVKTYCKATSLVLKGQCHEMVVEVRPWSGRLVLN